MQLTQKSRETVDACRFCWMCRHICPIGNATGQERNTSRARALALSMVVRNVEDLREVIDNVYECSLCGACTRECATGWDPVQFTLEVRLQGALEGIMPEYIAKLVDRIEKKGNVFGKSQIDAELAKAIKSQSKESETLLFLGGNALYKSPKTALAAIELLKKAKIDFTVLADEPNSGSDLYFLAGAADETAEQMKKTAETLNAYKTVVVYDPHDAKVFLREYKEWKCGLKAKVKTFTSFIADLIKDGHLKPKKGSDTFTFQDPPALARDLEETAPARKILAACGKVKDFMLNGKDTVLAGDLLMNEYMPDVMALVAKNRWDQARAESVKTVITACPSEYVLLKQNKPKDIEIMSIEEAVLKCL
ncbi:MAG: (Fe-S)-binding protein [Planctomycetia bacterium]|nr:(Fe-S)-binding protein [Planctomycetia bacterium]